MSYRLEEAFEQLRRYGGEPDERVLKLVEVLTDINDDLYNMRGTSLGAAIVKAKGLLMEIALNPELVLPVHHEEEP